MVPLGLLSEYPFSIARVFRPVQIEELAVRVVASGAMLVIIAGRQGSKEEVVTAQLCTALAIKGKTPATVRRQGQNGVR